MTDLLISRAELAGRIEGMGQALLHLTAALEMAGALDGEKLTTVLRERAESQARQQETLPGVEAALHDLADQLDQARDVRRSAAPQP